MKSNSFIILVVLFLCTCPALSTIHFNDGQTHNINSYIGESIEVDFMTPQMYTTVNIWSGAKLYSGFESYGSSQINISGGYIHSLYNYNSSQVNIFGGIISYLRIYDSSQVDIYGGSQFLFYSYNSSQVYISGGRKNEFRSSGSSWVNVTGGLIQDWFSSSGSSRVDISGGLIDTTLKLYDQSLVQIFGYDFAVDGQPFGFGELISLYGGHPFSEPPRNLTGTLLSGEVIDCNFQIGNDAKIILIPEPATVLLLGLGGLLIRKRC